MSTVESLQKIGLSEGESRVYLALLKLGSSTVARIKEETHLHRTTVYDFVEKLLNKGLINYATVKGVKHFNATTPEKLKDYIKEKQELVEEMLPTLKELTTLQKEDIEVGIHKGVEGFKTIMSVMLKEKQDMYAFGIDEQKFKDTFGIIIENFLVKEKEAGMKEYLLTFKRTTFKYTSPHMTYKYIPDEYFTPNPTWIFGEYVAMLIWEPLTIILTKSKSVAESHRTHFKMLWKMAKDFRD